MQTTELNDEDILNLSMKSSASSIPVNGEEKPIDLSCDKLEANDTFNNKISIATLVEAECSLEDLGILPHMLDETFTKRRSGRKRKLKSFDDDFVVDFANETILNSPPAGDSRPSSPDFPAKPKVDNKNGCYYCNECRRSFTYLGTYTTHMREGCPRYNKTGKNMSKRREYVCPDCGKQVSSRASLMVHMRQHMNEKPFKCDECDRTYYQKVHLTEHVKNVHEQMKNHENASLLSGVKPFYCNLCSRSFKQINSLTSHLCGEPGQQRPRLWKCEQCDKEYRSSTGLQEHRATHGDSKTVSCPVCCDAFTTTYRMRCHYNRMHRTDLPHPCLYCNKSFLRRYELNLHSRKHTGYRPFECDLCGLSFTRKCIMETHRTRHTGLRIYQCTDCDQAFNRRSKLKIHQTEHTGEFFSCDVCGRRFKDKSYIVAHLRRHSGEKRFECDYCGLKMSARCTMRRHIMKEHRYDDGNPYVTPFISVD